MAFVVVISAKSGASNGTPTRILRSVDQSRLNFLIVKCVACLQHDLPIQLEITKICLALQRKTSAMVRARL